MVDGDASGLVNAAAMGLLDTNPTILYAGTLDTDKSLQKSSLSHPADLLVTDTNRKRGFRWNSLEENAGYTETASQSPDTEDPSDAPLNIFPKAPADAQTTTQFNGISAVSASSYANSVTYFAEDRPSAALDNDVQTQWLDDSFATPLGQWWQIKLARPMSIGTVTLVQPQTGDPNRWITRVTLTFDGGSPVTVNLGPASRTTGGQRLTFPARRFTTMRIRVDAFAGTHTFTGATAVGFAEVRIPGVQADETVALPQDLLRAAGPSSVNDRLTFLFTRLRSANKPPRSDIEPFLSRSFWLSTPRVFSLTGQARISPLIPDDAIDRLVGRPGATGSGVVAYSSGRLNGDLTDGAIQTLDGNPKTAWVPGLGASHQTGAWLKYDLPSPITFSTLDLQLLADGQHSVPTSLTISTENGSRHLTLPPIADGRTAGSVVNVPLSFPALTGQHITITFTTVRMVDTVNYYSQLPQALPLGVAEVGIPGLHASPLPATIPSTCRDDLLSIDGKPVWIAVSGSTQTALARTHPLNVTFCGPDAGGIPLGAGTHTLTAAYGDTLVNNQLTTGFDLDRLALDSAPGGSPAAPVSASAIAAPPAEPTTTVDVTSKTATAIHLRVSKATAPFELIMGQSINSGWTAQLAGAGSLGKPVLIDAFANGWKVTSADLAKAGSSGSLDVTLRWTPQSRVNVALIVSALTMLLCLLLAYLPERVRRRVYRRMERTLRWPWRPSRRSVAHAFRRPYPRVDRDGTGEDVPWAAALVPIPARSSPGQVAGVARCGDCHRAGGGCHRSPAHRARRRGGHPHLTARAPGACRARLGGHRPVDRGRDLHGRRAVAPGRRQSGAAGWAIPDFGAASNLAWAAVVFLGADAVVELISRLVSSRSSAGGPKRPRGAHTRRRGPGMGPVDPSDPHVRAHRSRAMTRTDLVGCC